MTTQPPKSTPADLAAMAGAAWLDSKIERDPDPNELARIADYLDPSADSFAVIHACIPVAEAAQWVLGARRLRSSSPELHLTKPRPRW